MAETTETPLWNENEPAKVESWRLHVLLEAGYPGISRMRRVSEVDLRSSSRGAAIPPATESCCNIPSRREPRGLE